MFAVQQGPLGCRAGHTDVARGNGRIEIGDRLDGPRQLVGHPPGQRSGRGDVGIEDEAASKRSDLSHGAQLSFALFAAADDGDVLDLRPGEMRRGQRRDRRGAGHRPRRCGSAGGRRER
jgi:hypothetical protein